MNAPSRNPAGPATVEIGVEWDGRCRVIDGVDWKLKSWFVADHGYHLLGEYGRH